MNCFVISPTEKRLLISKMFSQLLKKDPKERLGCRNGSTAEDVKAQQFFKNINFRRLEAGHEPFGNPPFHKVPFELDVSKLFSPNYLVFFQCKFCKARANRWWVDWNFLNSMAHSTLAISAEREVLKH